MQTKVIVIALFAAVALFAFLPWKVEAKVGKFYTINTSICMSETRNPSETYKCKGCCQAKGYDSGKDNGNYCKCKQKGTHRTRTGDQIVEKGGWFSRDDVHEDALTQQESYGGMSHSYGWED